MRFKQIWFIDDNYKSLVIVCLKHIQSISAITEIWPVSCMTNMFLFKFIS